MAFNGKVICITGAGGNFGRAAVLYFAKEGANTIALDAVAPPLEETLKEHQALGTSTECLTGVCDITKPDQVACASVASPSCEASDRGDRRFPTLSIKPRRSLDVSTCCSTTVMLALRRTLDRCITDTDRVLCD